MDNIICRHGWTVVKFVVFIQIEDPSRGILNFPPLGQSAFKVPFAVVIGAERAGDFAPDAVQQRDAVTVRIGGFDGFGHADGDPRLGVCNYVIAQ